MKILKAEFDKIRLEIDEMLTGAFWLETYSLGLKERCRRLKTFLEDLERQQKNEAQT